MTSPVRRHNAQAIFGSARAEMERRRAPPRGGTHAPLGAVLAPRIRSRHPPPALPTHANPLLARLVCSVGRLCESWFGERDGGIGESSVPRFGVWALR